MKLFMLSRRIKSPAVLEYVSLPCLRILQHIIKPESTGSKKYKVRVCFQQNSVKLDKYSLNFLKHVIRKFYICELCYVGFQMLYNGLHSLVQFLRLHSLHYYRRSTILKEINHVVRTKCLNALCIH